MKWSHVSAVCQSFGEVHQALSGYNPSYLDDVTDDWCLVTNARRRRRSNAVFGSLREVQSINILSRMVQFQFHLSK